MSPQLERLINQAGQARENFISVATVTNAQAAFKPSEAEWSITENVEHIVWAEMGGINGMWKVLEATKAGQPPFTGELIHRGLSIEAIIEKTWKPKEIVPEVAKPRWGGSIEYWINALNNCQILLEKLGHALTGQNLEKIIHPHPISGPIDVVQRFEFLRFHLNRHQAQIERIKSNTKYPH